MASVIHNAVIEKNIGISTRCSTSCMNHNQKLLDEIRPWISCFMKQTSYNNRRFTVMGLSSIPVAGQQLDQNLLQAFRSSKLGLLS